MGDVCPAEAWRQQPGAWKSLCSTGEPFPRPDIAAKETSLDMLKVERPPTRDRTEASFSQGFKLRLLPKSVAQNLRPGSGKVGLSFLRSLPLLSLVPEFPA